MKFNCQKHGPIEYVLLDGYQFGDRLLEGVMFQVCVDDERKYSVVIDPGSADYFAQLNEEMWLDKASDYMKGADILSCHEKECSFDVAVDPWEEEWKDSKLFYAGEEV